MNGGGWTEIQNAGSTSKPFSGIGNGTYSYRARGCNVAGCGPYSAAQTVTVALPPPTPTSLNINYTYSARKYRFTATWSSSPGATSYQLQGYGYSGPNTSVSWTVLEANFDTSIEYYVRACNANGCSGWLGPRYAP